MMSPEQAAQAIGHQPPGDYTLDLADQPHRSQITKPLHSTLAALVLFTVAIFALPIYGLLCLLCLYHPSYLRHGIGILLWGIGIALVALVRRLMRIGRSLMATDASELLDHDHRRPVIYLRPFEEDMRQISDDPEGPRMGGIKVTHSFGQRAAKEERIAPILRSIGPFVAIGRPGDRLAPLGAARLYVADNEWQDRVRQLVTAAAAIVIQPESSPGAEFELTLVARCVDPRRVLMLVTNPGAYERLRKLAQEVLGVSFPLNGDFDAFMFDADGKPVPLLVDGFVRFVEQVRTLQIDNLAARWPSRSTLETTVRKVRTIAVPEPANNQAPPVDQPSMTRPAPYDFIGRLHRRSNWLQMPRDLLNLSGVILILLLAATATVNNLYVGTSREILVTGGILLAAAVWMAYLLKGILARLLLHHHPLGLALSSFGNIEAVRTSVDADFAERESFYLPLHIGRHWLCYSTAKQAMVQPIDDTMWTYCEEVRLPWINLAFYIYRYQLVLWMRDGTGHALPVTKRKADLIIDRLSRVAPWMNIGYSDVLKDAWNLDRHNFVEGVDQRRSDVEKPKNECTVEALRVEA